MSLHLDVAAAALHAAKRILVFTGAGISTESGIPDFRGPDGIWTKVDPAEFTIERYLHSSETRRRSWAMWSSSPLRGAAPNDGHLAVADLFDDDRMIGCVTQNIDGLHQAAGLPESAVAELHGNARHVVCRDCDARWSTEEVFGWVAAGDEDPHCPICGGIVKMTVISFGEMMPQRQMLIAHAWADQADAVIAVGTTLGVYPAADVPMVAAARGVPYIIVNMGPTEQDDLATVRIDGPAGASLRGIVQRLTA
jgi:NAD-dependent deacetylase